MSLILPNHFHDIRESNIGVYLLSNLTEVGQVHLLHAANATLYQKTDSAKLSYVVVENQELGFFVYII